MYSKLLPKTDIERIAALQAVLIKVSSQPKESLPFSMENVRFIQPFLTKLRNCNENTQNFGTQTVNPNTLRSLVDQLVLDIWEEVEYSYEGFDLVSRLDKAKEYGVKYSYTVKDSDSVSVS